MPLIDVVLADQDALLPWPQSPGRAAPQGVFRVEASQPFWAQCLADGSILTATSLKDVDTSAAVRPASAAGGKV
jgi:hypothetical protein